MKLIAGLGNPGSGYLFNRHNVGFMAIHRLLDRCETVEKKSIANSPLFHAILDSHQVALITPMSYMNRSGPVIAKALSTLDAGPGDLLVIHDDIDIADVRYKEGGGHGGHNGLRSIIDTLGSADFCRVRIGVGRPPVGMSAADYVLSDFEPSEEEGLSEALDQAVALCRERFITGEE